MTISTQDLEKIARLAYLEIDAEHSTQLTQEISSIMDFVDQLRAVDTTEVAPLFHPFALHQRLRTDEVTEEDCIAELEAIAPMFEDNLYLVPKVIESGK
ncbi:Asp-tRNA(Asn)/Glu-tRNA(Gln) amidotransferase subunit GatC [Legionella quateirensis]|uniref:Aspartyl/glutamyl-tRNA(Asn/Gln) amidotransferase subunit C n=1 Tax=Legionella quateirensis TaxID=45072 RepID=A0A378KSU3_9GAMM|nr:Asp-tRNA(Asn)/Glu-tRNA(Gln) amidotransferase subunit GatC [Legionella quateirensis]KTD51133.1 glutamyl/tRNA (Gln) amidotransferase subunit C [Legionella quateirensis]STY17622.1 glutamyl/tRNA (Gln) amidotransferase subunit C [Legionella quateirensis]